MPYYPHYDYRPRAVNEARNAVARPDPPGEGARQSQPSGARHLGSATWGSRPYIQDSLCTCLDRRDSWQEGGREPTSWGAGATWGAISVHLTKQPFPKPNHA